MADLSDTAMATTGAMPMASNSTGFLIIALLLITETLFFFLSGIFGTAFPVFESLFFELVRESCAHLGVFRRNKMSFALCKR